MTPEEQLLWHVLRNRRCRGLKFRRQVTIGPFIADFLCTEHNAIIEVDGGIHRTQDRHEHDVGRDVYLAERGYRTLRIWNDDIIRDLPAVLDRIVRFVLQ